MAVSPLRPPATAALAPSGLADVDAFLAAHPHTEIIEVMLPDTHGLIRGKWLPVSTIRKIWTDGVAIPLSIFGLDIWGREVEETGIHLQQGDKDGLCWPVAGTLKPVPWAKRPSGQVLISMSTPQGDPWGLDPRHLLQRIVDRIAAKGFTPVVAFELEFYLIKPQADGRRGVPVIAGGGSQGAPGEPSRQNMYSLSDLDDFAQLFHDVRLACVAQGLPADTIISEAAPGQFEVNLYHRADPMAAADDAVLLRRLIDGVARKHGLRATFMAKPYLDFAGSGMHVHCSFADRTGTNAFGQGEAGATLLRHAIGGCLATMEEAAPLFIQSVNGFRRLMPGSYAPTSICWGFDNRSVAVRVPNGGDKARRLEHRIAGADANPYLVLAAILAGMLEGIETGIEPPAPIEGNAYDREIRRLSANMTEALDRFVTSDFIARHFGEEYRFIWHIMKVAELDVFQRRITALEYETYL